MVTWQHAKRKNMTIPASGDAPPALFSRIHWAVLLCILGYANQAHAASAPWLSDL